MIGYPYRYCDHGFGFISKVEFPIPNLTILTRMCVPIRHYSGTPAWHYNQNRVITSRPQEHSMMSDASSEPMVEEVILMKLDGQIL